MRILLLLFSLVWCQTLFVGSDQDVNDRDSGEGGKAWREAIKARITALKEDLRACQTSKCRREVMRYLKQAIEKRMNNLRIGIRVYSENMIACDDDACRDSWNLKISILQRILNRHKMFLRDNTKGGKVWRERVKSLISISKRKLIDCGTDTNCSGPVISRLEKLLEKRFDNIRVGIRHYALKMTKCETDECYSNLLAQIKTLKAIVKRHKEFLEVYGRGGKLWRSSLKALIKQQKAEFNNCSDNVCRSAVFVPLKKNIDKRLENLNVGIENYSLNLLKCKDEECRIKWYNSIKTLRDISLRQIEFVRASGMDAISTQD